LLTSRRAFGDLPIACPAHFNVVDCVRDQAILTSSLPIAADLTAPTGLSEISFFGWLVAEVAEVAEVELSFFGEND